MSYSIDTPAMSESSRPIRMLMPLCLVAAAFLLFAPEARAQGTAPQSASASSDTVNVARPTGEKEEDRASILAALEEVGPGGTVQFAPGTYLVGELIRVTTSDITLLGHPDGTTLRGCHPGDFVEHMVALFACNGLELAGGRQTVRDLTFEYAWHGLFIGCCFPSDLAALEAGDVPPHRHDQPGGHLIEGNTFRNSSNGMRVVGRSAEPIVIRGNRFINTFHALVINGGTAHFVDNDVSTPDPAAVPIQGRNGGAITVMPDPPVRECGQNILAGNRIVDYADAIRIFVADPGARCERNVVRANTIVVRRNPLGGRRHAITMGSPSDTTVVGVPLAITNRMSAEGSSRGGAGVEGVAVVGNHLIEGNRIIGADGLGIEIRGSSGNRIVDNHVSGIEERDPFPGNTTHSMDPEAWRNANGSGIWMSAGSDENEVVRNVFEDIAGAAVVLEGNNNRVELRSADDAVRDQGRGNQVRMADGPTAMLYSEDEGEPRYEEKFIDIGGIRLHYIDFGGAGIPILFTAGSRSAETWGGFAPRFTDSHRVLAITDRGVPPSEGEKAGFARRADDILALLDTLGMERAILVANSNPAQILIYLAEHHPERLAGLVFLAPASEAGLDSVEDPSGAMYMVERGFLSVQGRDPDEAGNWDEEDLYLPNYLASDAATIAVPALTFVNLEGTRGLERSYYPLEVAELVASGGLAIPDSTARTYFERLAADEAMQAEVRAAWDGTFVPVFHANEQAFFRAFGDHLRVVRLDVPLMNGVPVVTGYEYRDAPELVEPHIRRFLEEVNSAELTRQDSVVSWLADRAVPTTRCAPFARSEMCARLSPKAGSLTPTRSGGAWGSRQGSGPRHGNVIPFGKDLHRR
jgi:parallel beta-helix repeat protein